MIFNVKTSWTFEMQGNKGELSTFSHGLISYHRKSARYDRNLYSVNFRFWRYSEWSER